MPDAHIIHWDAGSLQAPFFLHHGPVHRPGEFHGPVEPDRSSGFGAEAARGCVGSRGTAKRRKLLSSLPQDTQIAFDRTVEKLCGLGDATLFGRQHALLSLNVIFTLSVRALAGLTAYACESTS
jgi:hypothetical protein